MVNLNHFKKFCSRVGDYIQIKEWTQADKGAPLFTGRKQISKFLQSIHADFEITGFVCFVRASGNSEMKIQKLNFAAFRFPRTSHCESTTAKHLARFITFILLTVCSLISIMVSPRRRKGFQWMPRKM